MRRIFTLPTLLTAGLFGMSAAAQDSPEANYGIRCGGVFHLCGYIDRETEAEVIPFRFERAFVFSEGLAAVRIDGLFGFIDPQGEVVIEPMFDLAGAFHAGLAEVLVGDAVGAIDRTGQYVVEPQFARAIPFTENTVIAREGKWDRSHSSRQGKLVGFNGFWGSTIGASGIFHVLDGWITEPNYRFKIFDRERTGIAWATLADTDEELYGLISADGSWIVEPTYSVVSYLQEGRAVVRGPTDRAFYRRDGQEIDPAGAVDTDGTLVIPLEFVWLNYWSNGYALSRKDGLEGLIRRDGTLLAGKYFTKAEKPREGQLPRVFDGQKWYSVEPDGALIDDLNNGSLLAQCPSGLTIHDRNGFAEFSHPSLPDPIALLFDRDRQYGQIDCDKPIYVSQDDKRGFVTQTGLVISNPLSFDSVFTFRDGFAAVSQNGAWGIINELGEFVVPLMYDSLYPEAGRYGARKDGREFWIDAQGNEVTAPVAEPVDHTRALQCFGGGQFFAKNDLWGMLGPDGEVIIEPSYRALMCFSQGVAWGVAPEWTAWCPIGPDGLRRMKPDCQSKRYFYILTENRPEHFSDDPFENSVLWMRAFLDYGRGQRENMPVWLRGGKPSVYELPPLKD